MGRYTNPRIRVYNDALTLQGTITTVLHAEYECGLGEIGVGAFVIPLVDTPGRQYCVVNNVAVFTVEIDTTETAYGWIVITDIDDRTREAAGELIVSGYGIAHKLTYDRMNYTVISDGSGGKLTTAPTAVLNLSQYAPWGLSIQGYDSTPRVLGAKLVPANETLFEALQQAGAQDQYIYLDRPFYPAQHTISAGKDMDQLDTDYTVSSNYAVHFRPDADDTNTDEIPIPWGGIKVIENRTQVPTRSYIYGGGSGQDRFTNAEADGLITPPPGFSFDFATSEVINDIMEALSNQPVISDNKNFPDIKPEDPTDATTVENSAIALCEAGLTYLIARQQSNDNFYEISDTFVGKVVWPAIDYCRLTYSKDSPYNAAGSEVTTTIIDVDIATHILKVRYSLGADNVLMGSFLLGPSPRLPQRGEDETTERIQNVERRLDHLTASASINSPDGGPSYANSDGTYLVLSTNTILTNERQLVAGAGLAATDAGANSTYTVNVAAADTSLTINADNMQVRIATNSGLTISSGLQLGTPTTLTTATTNTVSGTTHAHAITTTTTGANSTIMATDAAGRTQVDGLGINTSATTDGAIDMPDDGWIGLGSSSGRLLFDNQATDILRVLDGDLHMNDGSNDTLQIRSSGDVGTEADMLGLADLGIAAQSDVWVFIDSNNDTTDAAIRIGKNDETSTGSTEIHAISEDGSEEWRSGVAHGMTALSRTNDWAKMEENQTDNGGALLRGLTDSSNTAPALRLSGVLAQTPDSTDTSGSYGAVRIEGSKKNGTTQQDLGTSENVFVIANRFTALALWKGNGDAHFANTSLTALDWWDDLALCRTYDLVTSAAGVVQHHWDQFIEYGREHLREVGVLHGSGDFISVQGMFKLHNGALVQIGYNQLDDREEIKKLKAVNAHLQERIAVLEAALL